MYLVVDDLAVLVTAEGADGSIAAVEGTDDIRSLEGVADDGLDTLHRLELLLALLPPHEGNNLDAHPRQLLGDLQTYTLACTEHTHLAPLSVQILEVAPPNLGEIVAAVEVLHPEAGDSSIAEAESHSGALARARDA